MRQSCWLLAIIIIAPRVVVASPPDWVQAAGRSAKYAAATHLTGFATSDTSVEAAKNQAAADLAKRLRVRIEQATTDVSAEKNGVASYSVAAVTRSTTDVRLSGLAYEIHTEGATHYALAILERTTGARERRAQRDQELERARVCMASGEEQRDQKKTSEALATFLSCRASLSEAVEHEAVARSIAGKEDTAAWKELVTLSQRLDDTVRELFARPASSLAGVADNIATQLALQGVNPKGRLTFAPLTYGTTPFSSVLGTELAAALERALAKATPSPGSASRELAVMGTYFEAEGNLVVRVTVREVSSGKTVAGADAALPSSAIPKELPLKPQNFAEAMRDQRLLAAGEEVSGDLRVELWTSRGDRGLVLREGDELKLHLKVNQPAYVRLIYIMANGLKVPLEQAYYIDAAKVNRAVEYPETFTVSPPFGIEQIYAVAFTEKPDPLPTKVQNIDGERYEVVGEASSLVKHRGLKKAAKKLQVSETVLSITTTPR